MEDKVSDDELKLPMLGPQSSNGHVPENDASKPEDLFPPPQTSPIDKDIPNDDEMDDDSKTTTDVPGSTREIPLSEKMASFREVVQEAVAQEDLRQLIAKRSKERRAKLIERFVDALTLHGFSHFYYAHGLRKALWALILFGMLSFFIGLTYLQYYSDGYYSQAVERTYEKSNKVDFPTITLCNYNPVHAKDMHKRFPIKITYDDFKKFYIQMMSNRPYQGAPDKTLIDRIVKGLAAKGYTSYSQILNLFEINNGTDIHSDNIDALIGEKKCKFEEKSCSIDKDFRTVYRNYGQSVCKQFNPYRKDSRGVVSTETGMNGGLLVYWNIAGQQYHYSNLHGLLVEIHHYGTPQHLIDYNNVLALEAGVFTRIELKQIKSNLLPPPFNPNCGTREFNVIQGYDYSKAMCEVDCLLEITLEKCGCVGDQFKDFLKPKYKDMICSLEKMQCVFTVDSGLEHERCHSCPGECLAVQYEMSTARLDIGNHLMYERYESLPGNEKTTREDTRAYISENIVGFRIVFKTLKVEVNKWSPAVKWYERISMVGGSIGLLLGFSFCTLCELIFFFFDYITTPMYIRTSRKHYGEQWRSSIKRISDVY